MLGEALVWLGKHLCSLALPQVLALVFVVVLNRANKLFTQHNAPWARSFPPSCTAEADLPPFPPGSEGPDPALELSWTTCRSLSCSDFAHGLDLCRRRLLWMEMPTAGRWAAEEEETLCPSWTSLALTAVESRRVPKRWPARRQRAFPSVLEHLWASVCPG